MAKEPVSTLKFSAAVTQIEKGRIAPVYFINGDEDYLQVEFIAVLRKKLFGNDLKNANIERITARAGKAADLVNTALEYSLFGGGKLIIVSEANRFSKADRDMLVVFFPRLPQGNHLVLFHHGKIDTRLKYFKYLTGKATWISFLPLTHETAKFWVSRQLGRYDLRIDPRGMDLLVDFAGLSYSTISEEVEKLSLNFESGTVISLDDVKNYGSRSAVFSIFELTEALGLKDREKALNRLERLLESGESIGNILSPILRHFNYLIMIESLNELSSNDLIAARIGTKPYFVQKCREQISKFGGDSLKTAMRYIFEAEYQSRYDKMPAGFILENLVAKITDLRE